MSNLCFYASDMMRLPLSEFPHHFSQVLNTFTSTSTFASLALTPMRLSWNLQSDMPITADYVWMGVCEFMNSSSSAIFLTLSFAVVVTGDANMAD